MVSFQKIAELLITLSQKIIELIKHKNDYAKAINYQINQLFEQLGQASHQGEITLIEAQNLYKSLSADQLSILFSKQNRQSSYITAQDLCVFLHISKHNLKRNNTISQIEPSLIQQFLSLLYRDIQLEEQLVNIMQEIDIQKWFGEVDFFNNGYIDTSALYEYFVHYDAKQQVFEEYNALLIIKTFKRHSHNDKITLQQMKQFLEKNRQVQIILTNEQQSSPQVGSPRAAVKTQERHIKNKSNQLYSLSSEVSIQPQIKIGKRLIDNHLVNSMHSLQLISQDRIQDQLRLEENITYEERLIRMHSRNEKYIKQAKRQMEGIIPICNVQIQSHLQIQASKASKSELIRKLKLLGDIFNKITKLIVSFLTSNLKFTFVNAFSILDIDQNNRVTEQRWKEFMKQLNINLPTKKISKFFKLYSTNDCMSYSNFLSIFKYANIEDQYIRCSTRYPLIYENWSQELLQNYKSFILKIVNLVDQRQQIQSNVAQSSDYVFGSFNTFNCIQEATELLGQQYREFIREYFQQENTKLRMK